MVVCDIKGGSYSTIEISGEFSIRIKKLYDHWNDDNNALIWGDSNVLVVETTPSSNSFRSSKSSAFHVWLFGLEFPNTTIVFGKQRIYYLCSTDDKGYFEVLKDPTGRSAQVQTRIETRDKDSDDTSKIEEFFYSIRQSPTFVSGNIIVGHIKDELVGSFFQWQSGDSFSGHLVDVSDGFSDLLSVKTKLECANVKMSAILNSKVMYNRVYQILDEMVTKEREVSHSVLSKRIEYNILTPSKEIIFDYLQFQKIHLCHPPTIQSGDGFDLSFFAKNNNNNLCYGKENVILCGIGSSYDGCCSYIARTFLFDPNEVQVKAYQVLLKAQNAAIDALKLGHKLSEAHRSALSMLEKENGTFVEYMTKTVGAGIGLEFTETYLSLNDTNELLVKAGMVFKVVVGLESVPCTSEKTFSMVLGDTVMIDENGKLHVLTKRERKAKKFVWVFNYE